MIGAVLDRVDKYLGRGRHSIAVPVMDGPLHPNTRLEEAPAVVAQPSLDNLASAGGAVWFTSGPTLLRLGASGAAEEVATCEAPVSCLAAAPDGTLAIGLDGVGILLRGGARDGQRFDKLDGQALRCATALAFLDADTLAVTLGARDRLAAEWKRDLMAHGASGEVWSIDLRTGKATRLAAGLAWPAGISATPGGVAVSEAWAHRVVVLEGGAKPREVLADLPGYPSRLIPLARGGHALAIFAPRNQLVEFVLREPEFLHAMTTSVQPDDWIAPKLMWGQGFKEPMQGAALKTMGIIKPWAPTWSYGLVVQLDDDFRPMTSFHSRADGKRHGVTSLCERDGTILAGARGAGVAVALTRAEPAGAR